MAMGGLRGALAGWTDYDVAGFELAKVLGVFPRGQSFGGVKRMLVTRSVGCSSTSWTGWSTQECC